MRIIIKSQTVIELTEPESARAEEMTAAEFQVKLHNMEAVTRRELRKVWGAVSSKIQTYVVAEPETLADQMQNDRDAILAQMLQAGEFVIPSPTEDWESMRKAGPVKMPEGEVQTLPKIGEPSPLVRGQVQPCGCIAGNHRPTCKWYSSWDRSPEYPPGYCIHGTPPGERCPHCVEVWPEGGGQE